MGKRFGLEKSNSKGGSRIGFFFFSPRRKNRDYNEVKILKREIVMDKPEDILNNIGNNLEKTMETILEEERSKSKSRIKTVIVIGVTILVVSCLYYYKHR